MTNSVQTKRIGPETGYVLRVQWSAMGDVNARKAKLAPRIAHWDVRRLGEWFYIVPARIKLKDIKTALHACLKPSDRAVVTHPFGEDGAGASAMHVWVFGRAVHDAGL